MKIKLAMFAKFREYLDPKPAIGERLIVEVEKGSTLRDLFSKFLPDISEIGIIMVNGIHQELEYQILEDDLNISVFPLSGGG